MKPKFPTKSEYKNM